MVRSSSLLTVGVASSVLVVSGLVGLMSLATVGSQWGQPRSSPTLRAGSANARPAPPALPYALTMSLSEVDVDAEALARICKHYGIARLDVFGSVARGDADPQSDIDVLYVLAPGTHLGWNIEHLADELAEVFGRPVDLASRNALHQRIRDQVLAEARLLYAA